MQLVTLYSKVEWINISFNDNSSSLSDSKECNNDTMNNDVAILKLQTPLTFNDKVQPACLPDASLTPSGIAVASGWGLVGQKPDVGTLDLMVGTYCHTVIIFILLSLG